MAANSIKIGYARISTIDQNPGLQIDALNALGCERIYRDAVSAVGKYRPGFERALQRLRPGDTLVIWKLDRAFRSTIDALVTWSMLKEKGIQLQVVTLGIVSDTPEGRYFFRGLASAAEFERDLISVRTVEGMAAAKRRGIHVGRPLKLGSEEISRIHKLSDDGVTQKDLAEMFQVSLSTVRRIVKGCYGVTGAVETAGNGRRGN